MVILFFLQGEYDALPEQAFYLVGPIEEVIQKAEKLAEEHSLVMCLYSFMRLTFVQYNFYLRNF